jgi:hypothetical protein
LNDLIYSPPAGFIGTDSFTYIVSGNEGGTATGTVTVTVWPALRIKSFEQSMSKFIIRFDAIPGRSYEIEGSPDLLNWSSLGSAVEFNAGQFQFEERMTDGLTLRFYRLRAL